MRADKTQFKGRFGQIAEFYGPEASYDAIKSEWKKVARLGDDLWRQHHGQQPRARAPQSTVPRRRQRHPKGSIKPEMHDIIDIDSNKAFHDTARAPARARKGTVSGDATRKRKLETGYASPEAKPENTNHDKRARLDSALYPNGDRNRNVGPHGEMDHHTLAPHSDDLFEQIRRAVSVTPLNKPNTDPHMVTSSPDVVMVPSTIEPMEIMQTCPSVQGRNLSFEWRERSQCQVSTAEHDRRDWEKKQQPIPPPARIADIQPQVMRVSPQAGPSRIRSDRFAEFYQGEARAPSIISLSDSDKDSRHGGDAGDETHESASTRRDKGKARMVEPPLRSFNQGPLYSMPSRVSYISTERGICYLCSVQFGTVGELRIHECGKYHSQMLTSDGSVEKAQARLQKYGLFQDFCSETENHSLDMPAAGELKNGQRQARTIIRGPDRAVDVDEDAADQSSLQDVVEVSQTKPSASRSSHKSIPRPTPLNGT